MRKSLSTQETAAWTMDGEAVPCQLLLESRGIMRCRTLSNKATMKVREQDPVTGTCASLRMLL